MSINRLDYEPMVTVRTRSEGGGQEIPISQDLGMYSKHLSKIHFAMNYLP